MTGTHYSEKFADTRPWAVGSIWIMDDGDGSLDLIRIVGYLHEDDPQDDTEVVYHVEGFEPGFMFSDSVERIMSYGWMQPVRGALRVG